MERKPQDCIQDPKFDAPDFVEIIGAVGRDNTDEETK